MQSRFHQIRTAAVGSLGLLLVLLVATTASAVTLSLADLQGGASFDDDSGALTFDNFEITISGDLSGDLEDYNVVSRVGGFDIVGPIAVADGNEGDIVIEYDVWANNGAITGASLWFNGAVAGNGSLASTTEDFLGDSPAVQIGELIVFVTGGGVSQKYDETTFDEGLEHIHVVKDIIVSSAGLGDIAVISVVQERFDTEVPEPLTGSLLGLGLLGLWRFGRRPAQA